MKKIKNTTITLSGKTFEFEFPTVLKMKKVEKETAIQNWLKEWVKLIEESKPITQRRKEKLLEIEKKCKKKK